ncbi:AraC-like DNA-binding protein [Vibrio diazotrophicus]|uniref:AraC-like DNA-binding protein n=1 Tax=Vibrio diazotrophicus TaxID=685 RepID=A0A329DVH0_VIBDI|nr:AraC family transcriptional regulator [Vibrio diazotrophicus]RAS54253.1 AraC-like DNA-binding protein [Vibrio diazotrophicus]
MLFTVERHINKVMIEPVHKHDTGQLIYMKQGFCVGQAEHNQWLIQKGMLVWIPPNVSHHAECKYDANLIAMYLPPEIAETWPDKIMLIDASKLAIGIIDKFTNDEVEPIKATSLLDFLLEELIESKPSNNILPLPTDRRLVQITQSTIRNPSIKISLNEWAQKVGACERTLSRLFIKETGLSYKCWINRLKHNKALTGLRDGLTNEELSLKLGFASGDSFSHWFQKEFNCSPRNMRKGM